MALRRKRFDHRSTPYCRQLSLLPGRYLDALITDLTDLMLLATFSPLTPVSLAVRYCDLARVRKEIPSGYNPPVLAILIVSCLGWFIWDVFAWGSAWEYVVPLIGSQVGGAGTALLTHLVLSFLPTPISAGALSRLLGIPEFEGNSWLRRRAQIWQKQSIHRYGSSIPKRVLENAMLIQKSLIEKGVTPTFTVEALQPVRNRTLEGALQGLVRAQQRREEWLRDPFLIFEVPVGNDRRQLTVDFWDEKEFDPEYSW